jgi:hypothetical protein
MLILKIYKKLTFILNSRAKYQKFYISLMFCIEIHWFTHCLLVKVSSIKTGLDVSINSNSVLVLDAIVKLVSILFGIAFLLMKNLLKNQFK